MSPRSSRAPGVWSGDGADDPGDRRAPRSASSAAPSTPSTHAEARAADSAGAAANAEALQPGGEDRRRRAARPRARTAARRASAAPSASSERAEARAERTRRRRSPRARARPTMKPWRVAVDGEQRGEPDDDPVERGHGAVELAPPGAFRPGRTPPVIRLLARCGRQAASIHADARAAGSPAAASARRRSPRACCRSRWSPSWRSSSASCVGRRRARAERRTAERFAAGLGSARTTGRCTT